MLTILYFCLCLKEKGSSFIQSRAIENHVIWQFQSSILSYQRPFPHFPLFHLMFDEKSESNRGAKKFLLVKIRSIYLSIRLSIHPSIPFYHYISASLSFSLSLSHTHTHTNFELVQKKTMVVGTPSFIQRRTRLKLTLFLTQWLMAHWLTD